MKSSFAFALLSLVVASVVGCAVEPANQDDQQASSELKTEAPLCGDGALASTNLQSGLRGGPDARSQVRCSSGYKLCKIDPDGSDNDVCSDAKDCFACVKEVALARGISTPRELTPPVSVTDQKGLDAYLESLVEEYENPRHKPGFDLSFYEDGAECKLNGAKTLLSCTLGYLQDRWNGELSAELEVIGGRATTLKSASFDGSF